MVDARTRTCANAACNKQMVEAHTDRRRCHIAIAAAVNIAATSPAASEAFQLRKQTNAARRPPEGAYGTEQSVSAVTNVRQSIAWKEKGKSLQKIRKAPCTAQIHARAHARAELAQRSAESQSAVPILDGYVHVHRADRSFMGMEELGAEGFY